MKNRHLIIIVLGCIILWESYMSRYGTDIINSLLWGGLIFIGFILFIITLIRNIIRFRRERRAQTFFTTYLILGFAIFICVIEYKNQYDLGKPSLLKVFYDGDFNGTGIDFKTDGGYIFDNSAAGMSSYTHGTYTISGNKITLDKGAIENVIVTDKFEIRGKRVDDGTTEKYLYQIDNEGNLLTDETEFKVIEDNRKLPVTLKSSTK